jgi:hypothetical protein
MLTFAQAITIARRSVKALSGISVSEINLDDTLDKCTVSEEPRVRLVKRLACESNEFGVEKYKHTLAFETLDDIDSSSTVGEFAKAIEDNAQSQ